MGRGSQGRLCGRAPSSAGRTVSRRGGRQAGRLGVIQMQNAVCWPKARKSPVSLAVLERVCAAAARACLEKPARQEKLPAASAEGREQLKGPCPVAGASGQPEKPRSHPHQKKNNPGERGPCTASPPGGAAGVRSRGGASPGAVSTPLPRERLDGRCGSPALPLGTAPLFAAPGKAPGVGGARPAAGPGHEEPLHPP